jgi:hypothetical protein
MVSPVGTIARSPNFNVIGWSAGIAARRSMPAASAVS